MKKWHTSLAALVVALPLVCGSGVAYAYFSGTFSFGENAEIHTGTVAVSVDSYPADEAARIVVTNGSDVQTYQRVGLIIEAVPADDGSPAPLNLGELAVSVREGGWIAVPQISDGGFTKWFLYHNEGTPIAPGVGLECEVSLDLPDGVEINMIPVVEAIQADSKDAAIRYLRDNPGATNGFPWLYPELPAE